MTQFLTTGSDFLSKVPDFKLVGRDDYVRRLSSILMRSKASSVLLVGPGGVGCTALCMGIQALKSQPDAQFDIVSKRMFWLDTDGLFSSGDVEATSKAFQSVLSELRRTPDSVLIVEDARDFIEGSRNSGCSHFINSLNSSVKDGDTKAILEVKDDDLDFVLRAHSDIKECYTVLDLVEPVGDSLRIIVTNSTGRLEAHHGIKIASDALDVAIKLTTKYRTRDASLSRAQPERTLNLLDRALSTYRLSAHKRDPEAAQLDIKNDPADQERIVELDARFDRDQEDIKRFLKEAKLGEAEISKLEEQIDNQIKAEESESTKKESVEDKRLSDFHAMTSGSGFESEAVRTLRDRMRLYQDEVKKNRTSFEEITKRINAKLLLTSEMVLAEFSDISGIPASKLNQDEREKLKNLEGTMKMRIFGQDHAIKKLSDAVKIARIGHRNGDRPQASFMFLGPSGVGKTETGKVLALNLLDSEDAITRFDMSEYMEKHSVAKLIGAPPGYELAEVGGILTNAMRENPRRILMFDEIEKAHPDVFNIFLQILSDGRLTDNIGRTVSFSDSIILMTTNIGQVHFLDDTLTFEQAEALAIKDLNETYKSEFLNRFAGRQNIVCFHKLGLRDIERIVVREVSNLDLAYRDNGIRTVMLDDAVNAFCVDSYDPKIGARGLPGIISSQLEPIIADTVLNNPTFAGELRVGYDSGKHHFTTELIDGQV